MIRIGIVAAAVIAAAIESLTPAYASPPTYNWSGAYAGLVGSYTWSHSQESYDNPTYAAAAPIDPSNASAPGIGVELGVNHQGANGFVVGLEGGFTYANLYSIGPDRLGDLHHGTPGVYHVTSSSDWAADLRARFGFAMDNLLVFGTAGVSTSHVSVSSTDGPVTDSAMLTGFVFGGGIEKALTQKVSVKLEYLHTVIGNHTWFSGQTYSATSSGSADSVRLGLNIHF